MIFFVKAGVLEGKAKLDDAGILGNPKIIQLVAEIRDIGQLYLELTAGRVQNSYCRVRGCKDQVPVFQRIYIHDGIKRGRQPIGRPGTFLGPAPYRMDAAVDIRTPGIKQIAVPRPGDPGQMSFFLGLNVGLITGAQSFARQNYNLRRIHKPHCQ